MFKFLGHTHFLEVWATSQEIMLFHDNGFVLLRFSLTNNPLVAVIVMLWLTGKSDGYPSWAVIPLSLSSLSLSFSLLALLVMNFDRYLATYCPIFHRTSVTKRKLLNLFVTLATLELILELISVNNFVISRRAHVIIFFIVFFPLMFFINYKLFLIARKGRRNDGISSEMKKTLSLKNIFEKRWNIARGEKDAFFEKYIELLASSCQHSGAIHCSVRLHWTGDKLEGDKDV